MRHPKDYIRSLPWKAMWRNFSIPWIGAWKVTSTIFWGTNLSRVRRHLILAILEIALLGKVATLAQPKINEWLYPPPLPVYGICSQSSEVLSGTIGPIAIANARKWAHIEPVIPPQNTFVVYNGERERVEFWLTDGTTLWEIEFVCFMPVIGEPGLYDMRFGEVYKEDIATEYAPRLKELRAKESGVEQ